MDPAHPPSPDGLDADPKSRDEFWQVIEDHHATYFCGHEHVFDVSQPHGKAYQVLVGSGGSPFEVSAPTNNPISKLEIKTVHHWGKSTLPPEGLAVRVSFHLIFIQTCYTFLWLYLS